MQKSGSVLRLLGSTIFGVILLSGFSAVQKQILGVPLQLRGFSIPIVYGAATGFLIGLWMQRLRTANANLREAVEDREFALRDIHHRIQNNLQVVSSLLAISAETESGHLRIDLMANIHRVLHEMNVAREADLRTFLENLVKETCQSYCTDGVDHLDVDTPAIFVPMDTAVVLGMIVNELFAESFARFPGNRQERATISVVFEKIGVYRFVFTASHLRSPVLPDVREEEVREAILCGLAAQLHTTCTITWTPQLRFEMVFLSSAYAQGGSSVTRKLLAGSLGSGSVR